MIGRKTACAQKSLDGFGLGDGPLVRHAKAICFACFMIIPIGLKRRSGC